MGRCGPTSRKAEREQFPSLFSLQPFHLKGIANLLNLHLIEHLLSPLTLPQLHLSWKGVMKSYLWLRAWTNSNMGHSA